MVAVHIACGTILVVLLGLVLDLTSAATVRPIIGILAQETGGNTKMAYPSSKAYIAAGYVKAVESSGARVVPVLIGQKGEYYTKLFKSINGLVIPGGASFFNGTNNYYSTGRILYQLAVKANEEEGDHFPILGVCLGFELLLTMANNEEGIRKECNVKNVNLPLEFLPNFDNSSLYRHASKRVIDTLRNSNVTVNWHIWCIFPEDFDDAGLGDDWKILSLSANQPRNSVQPFISSVEHKRIPLAGIQFHPEKNSFEWSARKNYPHSHRAIQAARHFYDWLVLEASKNNHSFDDPNEEAKSLIYNYSPVYSDQMNLSYTQMYLFN